MILQLFSLFKWMKTDYADELFIYFKIKIIIINGIILEPGPQLHPSGKLCWIKKRSSRLGKETLAVNT